FVDVRHKNDRRLHRNPQQREQSQNRGNAERRVCELQGNQRSDRLGHDHAQRYGDREFEISVEREEDEKNQNDCQRPNDVELPLGREELVIFATPGQPIPTWDCDILSYRRLAFFYPTRQFTALDAVLNSEVARVVLAINERRTISLFDLCQLADRNLQTVGRTDQQITDLLRAAAELRLHAHHQVKKFLALDHLRGCLAAHRRLNHRLHVRHIDSVARDLFAIDVYQ